MTSSPSSGGPAAPIFAGLGLRAELLAALDELGYEEPTPIQAATIPHLLDGHDLIGQAATGTGKTAAFALPILERIEPGRPSAPRALVLVPTRELAMQVSEAIFNYGRHLGASAVPIYGGQPIHRQFQQLGRGVHVVVATPGRALDHIGRGTLRLDDVEFVVLDEADEMLDMGFADDLAAILEATPETRQTVLFSATMPPRIAALAKRYQRDPVRVRIGDERATPGAANVVQRAYVVQRAHKTAALGRILDVESPGATLVFCRTRGDVDDLTVRMNGRGYRAEALHGGMDQVQRDRVMARLRDGTAELLIATDVAARGLDVDVLTHVVNYDVPSAPESYVHRIGRVGRAGRTGVAITLAEPREQRLLANIERLTKQRITLEPVPTPAELTSRRIDQTIDRIEALLGAAPDDDTIDAIIERLLGVGVELGDIARAAVRAIHRDAVADDDGTHIPDARRTERAPREGHPRKPRRPVDRNASLRDRSRDNEEATGFLHVSLGRKAGVRPGDLVGVIANEVGLGGNQIGPIRIADTYSVVGIPERAVTTAVATLQNAQIRGRRARIRRFVEH